jgi:hypothetical protein
MQESNKFGIVKKILVDFIKQRKTDKLALSIFADFAYIAVPLTILLFCYFLHGSLPLQAVHCLHCLYHLLTKWQFFL